MNYFKINSFLFACIFFAGSLLLVQCDRNSQGDSAYQEQGQQQTPQDQTDTDAQYGQDDMAQNQGNQTQAMDQDREQLISDMEDLRDDINSQLEQQDTEGVGQGETDITREEMQNDLNELDEAINNMRNTTTTGSEDEANQVVQDNQDVYDRLSEKYQDITTDTDMNDDIDNP